MSDIRRNILAVLKHSERLTPSEIHRKLNGHYRIDDIESELIAMDLDGYCRNDLVPQSRITQKGRVAKGEADASR